MKKLVTALFLASLIFPFSAVAADFSGVYLTPKVILGFQQGTGHFYINNAEPGNTSKSLGSRAVFGGALALGYNFSKTLDMPVRLELEYSLFSTASRSYTKTPTGLAYTGSFKIKSEIQSLFANAYFDINTGTAFTPYVGAGLGIAFNRYAASLVENGGFNTNASLGSRTSTNFAWNIGLGVSYAFTDTISADLGYRYAQFGKGSTHTYADNTYTIKSKSGTISMHQIMLGLRITY